MPVLENVHVSLIEVLEVRGCPLNEEEIWALMCQTLQTIEDHFLKGQAYKNDVPLHLVTPSSLQCTWMGKVILFKCPIDFLKDTPYWAPELNDLVWDAQTLSERDVEQMYVYTLGQTLKFASQYSEEVAQVQEKSSMLISVIQDMTHEIKEERISLSDLIRVCYQHAPNYTNRKPFSHFVIQLHQEVLGSLPESEILTQIEKNDAKENTLHLPTFDEDKSHSRSSSLSSICDNLYRCGQRSEHHAECIRNGDLQDRTIATGCFVGPRARWKNAFLKICARNRLELLRDVEECIPSLNLSWKYMCHKTGNSFSKVYDEELAERRKLLNLLRMNMNLGIAEPVDVNANNTLTNGLKHKSLAELAMLLHGPPKLSTSLRASSLDSSFPDKEITKQKRCLSDSNLANDNANYSLRKTVLTSNMTKAMFCENLLKKSTGLEEIQLCKMIGPEFIVKSQRPLIFLNVDSKEHRQENPTLAKPCSLTVILLSGQRLSISCDANISGKQLFNYVVSNLALPEPHLFGLAVHRDGEYLFVDGQQRICKLMSSLYPTLTRKCQTGVTSILTLYLRVKFQFSDIELFRHQETRHMFYVQMRKDILEGRIYCDEESALFLGGLALQAEIGEQFPEQPFQFLPDHYLPQRFINRFGQYDAERQLFECQSLHKGLSSEMAKLVFLQNISKLPEYGFHFHCVLQDYQNRNSMVWLGIDFNGIGVFEQKEEERCLCQNFPWHEIKRLTFTRQYLCLSPNTRSLPGQINAKHLFYTSEPMKSRCLYHMAVCHHQFIIKLHSGYNISNIFTSDLDHESNSWADSGPSSLGSNNSYNESGSSKSWDSSHKESLSWLSPVHDKFLQSVNGLCEGTNSKHLGLEDQVVIKPLPLTSNNQKKIIAVSVDPSKPFSKSLSSECNTSEPETVKSHLETTENLITCVLEKAPEVGLGLILTCNKDSLEGTYVERVVPGSSADQVLFPGDRIVSLNGENVEQYNFLEVVDFIQEISVSSNILLAVKRESHTCTSYIGGSRTNIHVQSTFSETSDFHVPTQPMLSKSSTLEDNLGSDHLALSVNGTTIDKENSDLVENQCLHPPVPKPRRKWSERGKIRKGNEIHHIQENGILPHQLYNQGGKMFLSDSLASPCCADDVACMSEENQSAASDSCVMQPPFDHPPSDISEDCDLSEMCKTDMVEEVLLQVTLEKKAGSLGFRITHEENRIGDSAVKGVYVHSLIPDGAALIDGNIQPGDRLLKVNGVLVEKLSYPQVVILLKECPSVTELVFQRCQQSTNPQSMIAKWGRRRSSSSTDVSSLNAVSDLKSGNSQEFTGSCLLSDFTSVSDNNNVPSEKPKLKNSVQVFGSGHIYEDKLDRISNNWNIVDVTPSVYKQVRSPSSSDRSSNSSCAKSETSDAHRERLPTFDTIPSSHLLSVEDSDVFPSGEDLVDNLKLPEEFTDLFSLSQEKLSYGALPDENGNQAAKYQLDNSPDESGIESDAHSAKAVDGQEDNYFAQPILPNIIVTPVPKQRRKKSQSLRNPEEVYKLLNPKNTFQVILRKSTRGLGFSIFGGVDSYFPDAICRLIRIRKLFPLQPAAESGLLQIGDIILEVNGLRMLGLTHTEALETLRVASTKVVLKIFRPDPSSFPPVSDFVKDLSPSGSILLGSPPGSAPGSLNRPRTLSIGQPLVFGDFEVTLNKVEGSLGFSVLYHKETCHIHDDVHPSGIYVKALIRDPAISDGRIQPGDRILNVNGVDVSDMTHAEAVNFLRSASDSVTLKLYRPADGLSPLSLEDKPFHPKPLRQEAREIVNAQKHNKGSLRKLRDRRRLRANSRESASSASGSDCSSFSPPASDTLNVIDMIDQATDGTGSTSDLSEGLGLNRNSRPKSLDVLTGNERKQSFGHKENGDKDGNSFHRQASVLGTCTEVSPGKVAASKSNIPPTDGQGLLKWRGFTLQTNSKSEPQTNVPSGQKDVPLHEDIPPVPPRRLESLVADVNDYAEHSLQTDVSADDSQGSLSPNEKKLKKLYIELDRGWHGRLGFSLRDLLPEELTNLTPCSPVVKAVHTGSIAFCDGRIKSGDRLIEVNGEDMSNHPASYAIDILRKTRGKIGFLFHRLENTSTLSSSTSHNSVLPS